MNSKTLRLVGSICFIFFILYVYIEISFTSKNLSFLINSYLDPDLFFVEAYFYNFCFLMVVISIFLANYYCLELYLSKAIMFGLTGSILSVFSIMYQLIRFSFYTSHIFSDLMVSSVIPILFCILISVLIWFKYRPNYKEESRIRKKVLDIGTKYPDFTLSEIAKECSTDKNTIIKVAENMAENKEIYARYFYGTEKFVFNKRANIEEIDNLMELYYKWEKEAVEKIV